MIITQDKWPQPKFAIGDTVEHLGNGMYKEEITIIAAATDGRSWSYICSWVNTSAHRWQFEENCLELVTNE